MITVRAIDYTGIGQPDSLYAARLLAYTKNTRLNMTPDGFNNFMLMPKEHVLEEINYMVSSIPSSWEFVDVTFAINNISRACAQQITRTRQASYAMQSQRVTNMQEATANIPETVKDKHKYLQAIKSSLDSYQSAVTAGESLEDARGLLPMNIHCNLIAKYNLRTLVDLLQKRSSLRVQGEYLEVVKQMRTEILNIWPWADAFFVPKQSRAIELIENVAQTCDKEQKMTLAKAADLLKGV